MGGMGNQMFQYAVGKNLSLKYNIPLKFDLSFLKNRNMGDFVYRDYDLDLFKLEAEKSFSFPNSTSVLVQKDYHYSENFMNELSDLLIRGNSINIVGYWQSTRFFYENESQIRKDFEFKDNIENQTGILEEMLYKIKSSNSVMVNVRRTDYLNSSFHGVLGIDYINKAKELIETKIENTHYFIFSDDINWCRENIHFDNMTIVDHNYKGDRFGYYLQLMSQCKHFIIPNSTFAWWSAYLNNNQEKIVVAPIHWFTDSNVNTKDLIPSNWYRI